RHRGPAPRDRHQPVPRAGVGGALSDRRTRLAGAPRRALRAGYVSAIALRPTATRSPLWIVIWAVPIAALLAVLPWVLEPYRTIQMAYGLIFAIAGLGFNILLGYTGLLSFGHSAYFGVGAYAVAFMVKYLHVQSMELFLIGTIVASMLVTAFVGCVAVMWLIVHSPFGKALQAIRDNETRARFVGIRIRRYRFMAFLVSGVFTGIAGALWVPLNGLTTPDILYWPFSGEIVFMSVLGGFRNFTGPIVGAVVFNYLKTYAVGFTVYWQALMGVILVVLVMTLPTGIVGSA